METGLLDTESGGSELAESPYLSILTMVTDKDEVSEEGDTDVITLRPKTESDGDDESDEEEDEEDTDLRDRSLRHCVHSRPCSICIYLVIALVILASLVAMIVIGVLIVAPFRRVSGFAHTTCETVGLETRLEHKRCSCGKGCNSKYPCIKVAVITPELVEEHKNHVVLFDNEATLLRECTYYPPCKSSRIANEKAVQEYKEKYGTRGHTFSCLYNPDNPQEIIRTRRFHMNHVIHGMLWSSLVFLLSLVVLIVAIRKKGCDFL